MAAMKRVYSYEIFPTIGYATNWLNQNPRYVLVSVYPTEDGKVTIVYFHIENDKTSAEKLRHMLKHATDYGKKEEAV